MTREEIILKHIKRDGRGLEIGPGCAPIAPKKQGFHVHVLDHCDKKALIEKYRPHGINVDNLEEVDFVWDGRSYTELVGRRHVYDWIIGSHVLENTTNLIGFLNDCDSLLKKEGVLSLAVPDKRYCFDHFRPLSSIGRVIDAARNPQKIHSAGTVAEYFLSLVSRGGRIAWGTSETSNPQCERAWVLSRCPRMVFHPNFVSTDDARLI
jgi:2-polyprenyl-3-methyl-5-hydroxy-6-metoxy-1,4-benzoquinol methylase